MDQNVGIIFGHINNNKTNQLRNLVSIYNIYTYMLSRGGRGRDCMAGIEFNGN